MSAQIIELSEDTLTLKVSGTLTQLDLSIAQQAADRMASQQGKLRILILAEDFKGWERGKSWGEFPCQTERDDGIERMAIVGDPKWEDLAIMFTAKGLRSFPIEYFPHTRLAAARAWLAAEEGAGHA
jgi:stage II sporulation SpoAA-like protein